MQGVMAQVIDIVTVPAEAGGPERQTRMNLVARCEPVCFFDQSMVDSLLKRDAGKDWNTPVSGEHSKSLFLDNTKELMEDPQWPGLRCYLQSKWLLQIPFWEESKFRKNSVNLLGQDFDYGSGLILEEAPEGCFRRVGMFSDYGVAKMFDNLEDKRKQEMFAAYTPPPMPPKVWQEERTETVPRTHHRFLDELFSNTTTRIVQQAGWVDPISRKKWKKMHFEKEVESGSYDFIQRRHITLV